METRRIAMWSGPRNISTAMMRSWGSRADTAVVDEPFYAHYLLKTGIEHPGKDDVIAHHETDWRKVADQLTGQVPDRKRIFYQKHMAHHMLDGMSMDWLLEVTNCFLIREPAAMLASLTKVLPNPAIEQTGLPQQIKLFRYVREKTGQIPPVLDSATVLKDPRAALSWLCTAVNLPFDEAMLSWEAGPRETDGIWAKHWYAQVEQSTGFLPYRPKQVTVPDHLQGVLAECEALYQEMASQS